jgi:hypothetical protein
MALNHDPSPIFEPFFLALKKLFGGSYLAGESENSPGVTSTNSIPTNILAFRTITTLLAQIPRATQLKSIDYLEVEITDRPSRRILKISDAFAHIAGGPQDITAVTTNHAVHSRDLQVLVTSPSVPVSLRSTQPNGLLSQLSFMCTRNDRRDDDPPSKTCYPTMTSPHEPLDLNKRSADDYLSALLDNW